MSELQDMWAFLKQDPPQEPSMIPERLMVLGSYFARFCELRALFYQKYQEAKALGFSTDDFKGLKNYERAAHEEIIFSDFKKEEASFDYLAKAFHGTQECLKSAAFLEGQIAKLEGGAR